jgi:hypothetical protein
VFQLDVAKVNRDVAHVAMVVHVCCNGLSPMFHLCFPDTCCKCVYPDVCICFIHTLHVFYLDVAYGCNGFQVF